VKIVLYEETDPMRIPPVKSDDTGGVERRATLTKLFQEDVFVF